MINPELDAEIVFKPIACGVKVRKISRPNDKCFLKSLKRLSLLKIKKINTVSENEVNKSNLSIGNCLSDNENDHLN